MTTRTAAPPIVPTTEELPPGDGYVISRHLPSPPDAHASDLALFRILGKANPNPNPSKASAADDVSRPLRWGPSHSPENSYRDARGGARHLCCVPRPSARSPACPPRSSPPQPGETHHLSYDVALDLAVMLQTFGAARTATAALRELGELRASDVALADRLEALGRRLVSQAALPRIESRRDDKVARRVDSP
jgi:hypothetical protein